MRRPCLDLAGFLVNAPSLFDEGPAQDEEIDPDITDGVHRGAIRRFCFDNGDKLSCVRWDARFHITSTDIIRALVHRFEDIRRPVVNIKKFEEGVFSDLRCLKPGTDARLELPRSEFLELLYKHHCVRTQKKQKVFYWTSVPHDLLFREALERDLKREAMGIEPTTKITEQADPSSFVVIGGVELPLSVPPTLAAHMCMGATSGDLSSAHARVTTAMVTTAAAIVRGKAATSVGRDKAVDAGQSTTTSHSNQHRTDSVSTAGIGDTCGPTSPLHASSMDCHAMQTGSTTGRTSTAASTASQPTLSEYITGRSAVPVESTRPHEAASGSMLDPTSGADLPSGIVPMNDSWTGADFQTLHKKASELRADYSQYQPTPTPQPSPTERAVGAEGLLDLLSGDPNALVTQNNVGDFSTILDQLLGGSGRLQERTSDQDSPFECQIPSFGGAQSMFSPLQTSTAAGQQPLSADLRLQTTQSASSMNMEVDITSFAAGSGSTLARSAAMADSMTSSPSVISMANSQHMSSTQTPEISAAQRFGSSSSTLGATQPVPLNELDSLLASVSGSSSAPLNSSGASANAATMGISSDLGPGFAAQTLNDFFPLFGVTSDFPGMTAASVPFSSAPAGEVQQITPDTLSADTARSAAGDPRPTGSVKQPWFNQMPVTAPTPRSTRFSRYHPYLKTMARIAHRGSPSLVNRVPSTADPNVAAAAVNAMVATSGRGSYNVFSGPPNSNSGDECAALAPPLMPVSSTQDCSMAPLTSSSFAGFTLPSQITSGVEHDDSTGEPVRGQAKRKGKLCDEDDQPRRYPCTFSGCSKQFKRHEHLKRHFRTHTGERPYKCPTPDCGKVFARMDNLNQHIRTHVNRKTAARNSDRKPADSTVQQQQQQQPYAFGDFGDSEQAFPSMGYTDDTMATGGDLVGLGEGSSAGMATYANAPGLVAMDVASGVDSRSAVADVSASIGLRASGSEMRAAVPDELSLLSREWFASNLGSQQQQLTEQLAQQQQPLQSPLLENNVVSMLRKLSKNNRARVVNEFGIRPKDEQAFTPYGPSGGVPLGEAVGGGGNEGASGSGLLRTLSVESNASSINPVWLASFMAQEQRQQVSAGSAAGGSGPLAGIDEAAGAAGSRPVSLKRHHEDAEDDDDSYGDVSMGDGMRCSASSSGSERQGAPVTGGVGANKFVRSGMTRKSHIMPV